MSNSWDDKSEDDEVAADSEARARIRRAQQLVKEKKAAKAEESEEESEEEEDDEPAVMKKPSLAGRASTVPVTGAERANLPEATGLPPRKSFVARVLHWFTDNYLPGTFKWLLIVSLILIVTDVTMYEIAGFKKVYNQVNMAAVEQVLHHAGPVVFFLGQAGAGKSTHINKFSGSTLQTCHSMEACTKNYGSALLKHADHDPNTYPTLMIDTPGWGYDQWADGQKLMNDLELLAFDKRMITSFVMTFPMSRVHDHSRQALQDLIDRFDIHGSIVFLITDCNPDNLDNIELELKHLSANLTDMGTHKLEREQIVCSPVQRPTDEMPAAVRAQFLELLKKQQATTVQLYPTVGAEYATRKWNTFMQTHQELLEHMACQTVVLSMALLFGLWWAAHTTAGAHDGRKWSTKLLSLTSTLSQLGSAIAIQHFVVFFSMASVKKLVLLVLRVNLQETMFKFLHSEL